MVQDVARRAPGPGRGRRAAIFLVAAALLLAIGFGSDAARVDKLAQLAADAAVFAAFIAARVLAHRRTPRPSRPPATEAPAP